MQITDFVNHGIHLCLEVGTEGFVEPFDIARLGMADTTDELILHIEETGHQFVHLLTVDSRHYRGKYYSLGEKFAHDIIYLFFQCSSLHKLCV